MIHIGYSLALQRGYQVGDLTVVYPIARGTGPLFSVLGAIVLLDERLSPVAWLGIATIFLGILLIAGGRQLFCATRRPGVARGLRWGHHRALHRCLHGDRRLVGQDAGRLAAGLLFVRSVDQVAVAAAVRAARRTWTHNAMAAQWQRNASIIVAVGILSPLAYTLVRYAMTRAPLSYVAPIRELSMMIAALLGARLLSEDDAALRIAGSALMAVGVVILTLS